MSNILIRFPNWVGDVVMALPLVNQLSKNKSPIKITVAIRSHLAPLLKNCKEIAELFPLSYKDEHSLQGIIKTRAAYKKADPDAAFMLPVSFSSALPIFLAGAPKRIGWMTDGRSFMLNRGIRRPPYQTHQSVQYLEMLREIGMTPPKHPEPPQISLSKEDRKKGIALLETMGLTEKNSPIVAINGSAIYGPAKKWLPLRYGWVIQTLKRNTKARIILVGGPEDRADLEFISGVSNSCVDATFVGDRQTGLADLIALLSQIDILISNDTGAAHVAGALGKPALTIFGATSPEWTAPLGRKSKALYKPSACSPCFKKHCLFKRHLCMENVSARAVADGVISILEGRH